MPEGREAIPWSVMVCILTVARFCAPSSELQIAESWYDKTALDELLGVPMNRVNDDRLIFSKNAASKLNPPHAVNFLLVNLISTLLTKIFVLH